MEFENFMSYIFIMVIFRFFRVFNKIDKFSIRSVWLVFWVEIMISVENRFLFLYKMVILFF